MADQQQHVQPPPQQPQLPPIDPNIVNFIDLRFNDMQREIEAGINAALKPLQDVVLGGLAQHPPRAPAIKVNPPPNFDGSRERGESFMRACTLYMQLNNASFPDDVTAIGWILTYMAVHPGCRAGRGDGEA